MAFIKCGNCKREFIHNPSSIYKRTKSTKNSMKTVWYCGYTCWMATEPKSDIKKRKRIEMELKGERE